MRRQTNEFQSVVFMLNEHIDPEAEVTESAGLRDLVSNREREVDVVIRGTIGGRPVTVSIECRDHERRQGVKWVDEMQGKHSRLPTSLLVLASKSGFTAPARDKAASWGIETITPEELTAEQAGELADRLRHLILGQLDMQPFSAVLRLEPEADDEETTFIPTEEDLELFTESGEHIGYLHEAIEEVFAKLVVPGQLPKTGFGRTHFMVMAEDIVLHRGDPPQPFRMHIQVSWPGRRLRGITALYVTGQAGHHHVQTPMRHEQLDGIAYSWGKVDLLGPKVFVVMQGPDGEPLVRFKDPDRVA
jgi:hypothetical protein